MTTISRPGPGMLLPLDDPRVTAAWKNVQALLKSSQLGYEILPQDAAEIVNAVLAAEDEIHDRPTDWSRSPELLPDLLEEGPTTC